MRVSQLLVALIVMVLALAGLGSLAVLLTSPLQLATILVLALVVLTVVATSALGGRSRRWLSNPYW